MMITDQLSPFLPAAAIQMALRRSMAVVLLLLMHRCCPHCFMFKSCNVLVLLYSTYINVVFWFCNYPSEVNKAGCFALFAF